MNNATVIVPLHNSEKWVLDLYFSIASNASAIGVTVTIEFFDDFSSDNTWEVITCLPKVEHVKVLTHHWSEMHKAGSSSKAYAKAIQEVSPDSEIYIFSDHDDIWLPNKLERIKTAYSNGDSDPWLYAGSSLNWNPDSKSKMHFRSNPGPRGVSHVIEGKIDKKKTIFEVAVSTHNIAFNNAALNLLRENPLTNNDILLGVEMDNYVPVSISAAGKSIVDLVPTTLWRQHTKNASGNFKNRRSISWKIRRISKAVRILDSGYLVKYICVSKFSSSNVSPPIFYLPKNKKESISLALSRNWKHWSPYMDLYLRIRILTMKKKTRINVFEKMQQKGTN